DYSPAKTAENLARLLKDEAHHTILVYVDDAAGKVAGYVHAALYEETYFAPMINIMALAVDSAYQKRGIGSKLMLEVERLARAAGISAIRLNSGERRTGAHRFYEHLGYVSSKKQKRFGKKLI
ncbi:GNAT family N-acetyltransferase, partial [Lactobacillus sp. XV13L]|nr:GNAT family N-acetyltransferase [Lactobacillus sp. XV13L]